MEKASVDRGQCKLRSPLTPERECWGKVGVPRTVLSTHLTSLRLGFIILKTGAISQFLRDVPAFVHSLQPPVHPSISFFQQLMTGPTVCQGRKRRKELGVGGWGERKLGQRPTWVPPKGAGTLSKAKWARPKKRWVIPGQSAGGCARLRLAAKQGSGASSSRVESRT